MRYYIEHLPMTIPMGVQSENNAEAVEFDVSDWLARDGSLSFSVWVTRPGETEAYQAANATLKDGILYWWPTGADTAIAGEGRVEILAVSANRRMLSGWTATSIRETTTETTTDAPVDQRPWLDQALLASEEAKAAAASAAASADQAEGVVKKEIATLTEDIARNTAPPIIPTATGSIVTITDGAARPAVELISHIEPVETGAGEKGPNNPWAISGWNSVTAQRTGKNLLPEFVSGYWGVEGGEALESDNWLRTPYLIPCYPGNTYTLNKSDGTAPTINGNIMLYDSEKNGTRYFSVCDTFTIAENERYIGIYADIGSYNSNKPLQLESSPVSTAYEPYQGQTLSATLPETVYGGDVYWHTGKMIITKIKRKIGRSYSMGLHAINTHGLAIYRIILDKATANNHYGIANWLPHNYSYISDFECFFVSGSTLYVTIDPNRLATNDAEGFAAYLDAHPLEIVYDLAAPEEIQLTPQQLSTLKGTNNVWSDCGDTTLSYVADTEMWATQKFAAIAAAMLAN